ncbi:MAG: alpha-ketoacid dehydrogenase subunit beta [Nitrospinota bacterium]
MKGRRLKSFQAINEAIDLCMAKDPAVYLIGLGAPDPKGIFGSTLGLQHKYGDARVMDMPTSENAMTGVVIGSALVGMRPIMVHQRLDFALLAVEEIVNNAAKWYYMFGGQRSMPLVIRMVVGRGWGQGPQHSQSLEAWYAHVPGLKVVMPATAYDTKGLLIASIEDDNPVIFIEHRWLHNLSGDVPEGVYRVPLGKAHVSRQGRDLTIASSSYMTLEAIRAADVLAQEEIRAEVIDIRTLKPLDEAPILESVRKTGRFIVATTGWKTLGFGAEVVARISEEALGDLKCPPRRVALPDCPTPSTPALANHYYPRADHIIAAAREMLGLDAPEPAPEATASVPLDVPDPSFTGPF